MPRSLDRDGQSPLVPRTGSELPPRLDLASLSQVASQPGDVLVINRFDAIDTEHASLSTRLEPATTTAAAAGASTAAAITIAAVALFTTAALSTRAETRTAAAVGPPFA